MERFDNEDKLERGTEVKMYARAIAIGLATVASVFLLLSALSGEDTNHASSQTLAIPGPTDWVLSTSVSGTLSVVDAASNTVYGPFLGGQLGSEAGVALDVAVTPDHRTALISNFGDKTIFFVNVSNPIAPSVVTSATLPFFAEDIAITHDSKFALVTDGGFSPNVASIDINAGTVITAMNISPLNANAVDVAPDGTVVMVSYVDKQLYSTRIDESGYLSPAIPYTYTIPGGEGRPVNVAIAPDGLTVIVCEVAPSHDPLSSPVSSAATYKITAPGVLSYTGVITPLHRSIQSVAFSPAGDKAYLSGNGGSEAKGEFDSISVLNITGPGLVSLDTDGAFSLPRFSNGQLFGVDTIAVAGGKAYVGYPSQNVITGTKSLAVVDLHAGSVVTLTVNSQSLPTGVAAMPASKIYLPLVTQGSQGY